MLRLSIAAVLTLIAFASNSVLNRMAVAGGHISVGDFAIYRVAAGAVTLIVISLIIRRLKVFEIIKQNITLRILGGLSLATYMLGFSLAYLKLDAGLGSGIYLVANLGPGPRDGLMTGLTRVTNLPIAFVRASIEITVVLIGWYLGGTVGIGTLIFAFGIGPAVATGLFLVNKI